MSALRDAAMDGQKGRTMKPRHSITAAIRARLRAGLRWIASWFVAARIFWDWWRHPERHPAFASYTRLMDAGADTATQEMFWHVWDEPVTSFFRTRIEAEYRRRRTQWPA